MKPRAHDIDCLSLDETAWPVSYRFHVAGEWGSSQQALTFDIPALAQLPDQVEAVGGALWKAAIAPAITDGTYLVFWEWIQWKGQLVPGVSQSPGGRGSLGGASAPREDSAVLILVTGAIDRLCARRVHLPGTPARHVANRLLTVAGRRSAEAHSQAMVMGLCVPPIPGPLAWLNAYPDEVEPEGGNLRGVAFRRVTHVAVAHHTSKAPAATGGQWP